ncbi:MAG TPA: phage baseplate assembly protein V [Blastocatellia bacterium]|nr:phage baseplate assembly protein V [Blastocatellia bacterium]
MSSVLEIVRKVVAQELARRRSTSLGVVSAVFAHTANDDENNYEANVKLKHEDLELRKVPLAVSHVGFVAPPRVGDLVLVEFVNGDLNQPIIAGRFYHADERPPLHKEEEVLFEHRIADKLNHLRFAADGSIFLQREVKKPEDNSEAKTSIRIDGASGDLEIKVGDKLTVTLKEGSEIQITADGKPVNLKCSEMKVEGKMNVTGDVTIDGVLTASSGGTKTKITGSTIEGS